MSANVVKAAQDAVAATHDQQRLTHALNGKVVVGICDLIAEPDDLPCLPKKVLPFALQQRRIEIGVGGKSPRISHSGIDLYVGIAVE